MMGRLSEILTRKIAGVPVWIIMSIGILGLAWYLRRRAAANAAAKDTGAASSTNTDVFPNAQPMPWTSDIFVNIQNPPQPININVPPPVAHIPEQPWRPIPLPHPSPVPTPAPPPKQTSVTYVVKSGDTLWGIATKLLGSGAKYTAIYNANKALIEAQARQHGFSSSGNGHWIFPGEQLVIPK